MQLTLQDLQDSTKFAALQGSGLAKMYPRQFSEYQELVKYIPQKEKEIEQLKANLEKETQEILALQKAGTYVSEERRNNLNQSNRTIKEFSKELGESKNYLSSTVTKNLVDAVNAGFRSLQTEAAKADDVLTAGYDQNTPRYKAAMENFNKMMGELPEFLKAQAPKIGSGFSGSMSSERPWEKAATGGTTNITSGTQPTTPTYSSPDEEAKAAKAAYLAGGGVDLTASGKGMIPGNKNIYPAGTQTLAGSADVNKLFQAYHNRPANQQEIAYWSKKGVGQLEDTLAKTQIFSGSDADKIRAQMMAEGKTYIANQAELEKLAQTGGLNPNTITQVSSQTGMMFTPTQAGSTPTQPGGTPTTPTTPGAPVGGAGTGAGTPTPTNPNSNALSMIDNSNLPDDLKALWRKVVSEYPDGIEFNAGEILNTFNRIKNDTIDPHFRELTTLASDQFSQAYENLQISRSMDLEKERFNEGESIRQAKDGQEKAGMTFTGRSIELLGKNSAYPQSGQVADGMTPAQAPFGGPFYEGVIPMNNRWIRTSSEARYKSALQTLGRGMESQLGTSGFLGSGGIAGYTPLGDITGELPQQQQAQYGSTMNQLINNYQSKQNLLTNQY